MNNEYKLIFFDLNKTLIAENSWLILNAALGITKHDDKIMLDQYNSGEISYHQWQKELEGYYLKSKNSNRENITKILANYTYLPNAVETIKYLIQKNYTICLLSGAPDIVVKRVADELNIEYWFSNNYLIFNDDGSLKQIDVIDDEVNMKVKSITKLCKTFQIEPEECVCVGDGDNDIGAFELTKHGITFQNSKIKKSAWKVIDDLAKLRNIL